jgi:hypothetical protein
MLHSELPASDDQASKVPDKSFNYVILNQPKLLEAILVSKLIEVNMKRINNSWKVLLGICLAIPVLKGCSQQAKDKELKADVTLKAKDDVNFAGLHFFVEKGVVKLFGSCPTSKSRELIKQKLSTIHVIDSLEDHLVIAPVTLGPSFALKQQADSVLAQYPTVAASVSDTAITLLGEIEYSALQKLLPAMQKVHPNVKTSSLINIKAL